ncbi:MAG: AAA family ATPase [Anaerolineales bacterium]|nr:AAA family ATPase [Anaerolineales bacterium]
MFSQPSSPSSPSPAAAGSLALVLGPLGVGKTALGIDLAVSAALGSRWLGLGCPQPPALFVDYASGLHSTRQRARAALEAHQAQPHVPFYFTTSPYLLSEGKEALAQLDAQIASLQARTVVLDSPFGYLPRLSRAHIHALAPTFMLLQQMAASTNAAIVVLHDLARQRTSLASLVSAAGVDHVLMLSPLASGGVHLRTLASQEAPAVSIFAKFAGGRFHLLASSNVSSLLGPAALEVLASLKKAGTASTADLQAVCRSSVPTRTRTLVAELVQAGYIYRADPGSKGTPAFFRLSPAGESHV